MQVAMGFINIEQNRIIKNLAVSTAVEISAANTGCFQLDG